MTRRLQYLVAAVAVAVCLGAAPAALGQAPGPWELPDNYVLDDGSRITIGTVLDSDANKQVMTIRQPETEERTVIRWGSFNIGKDAQVNFVQEAGSQAATLNIVQGRSGSTLAGTLTATGSIFLVNPFGITITETGVIDTGGMFAASTLRLAEEAEAAFRAGEPTLAFASGQGDPEAAVVNQGKISARDAVLLGTRVENNNEIVVARLGRVALASGSAATLDLTGDGFLQVLAPVNIRENEDDDSDPIPLVSNTGSISAPGGLVLLEASAAYKAVRQAINMPGTISARSVAGENGRIVFTTGEGNPITITGQLDVSPDEEGAPGGHIRIEGSKVDLEFSRDGEHQVRLGEGGLLELAADYIAVAPEGTPDGFVPSAQWTLIFERGQTYDGQPGSGRSDIGDLLRAGVNVRLHANDRLEWYSGLKLEEGAILAGSGKAGDVELRAGTTIELGGLFQTYNSNWTLVVNVPPVSGIDLDGRRARISTRVVLGRETFFDARFAGLNGHLTLKALGGDASLGLQVDSIELPRGFRGAGLTAIIEEGVPNYLAPEDEDDPAFIDIFADVEADGDIVLDGHLRVRVWSGALTLKGSRVVWTAEKTHNLVQSGITSTGQLNSGAILKFEEAGVLTRIGRGGVVDATRLILGSIVPARREYGDANPDIPALEDEGLLLVLAEHSKAQAGQGVVISGQPVMVATPDGAIPLEEVFAPGSFRVVSGPDVKAPVTTPGGEPYYLVLEITGSFAFKPVEIETREEYDQELGTEVLKDYWVSGALGGYWIDLTGPDANGDGKGDGARVPVVIEPRTVTVRFETDPRYFYSDPSTLFALENVLEDDLPSVVPAGELIRLGGMPQAVVFESTASGFRLSARLDAGEYSYTVTGLTGDGAGNYRLAPDQTFAGSVTIDPTPVTYWVDELDRFYGETGLPVYQLSGLAPWHENDLSVRPVLQLFADGEPVENDARLPVGTYSFKVVRLELEGDAAGNYVLSGGTDGRLAVKPKEITWSVPNASSTYGTKADVGPATLFGVLPEDEDDVRPVIGLLELNLDQPVALGDRTPAGVYRIVVVGLTGDLAGNYAPIMAGSQAGRLEVAPLEIVLDADLIRIVYGDTSGRQLGQLPLPRLVGVLPGDEWGVALNPDYFELERDPDYNYAPGVDVPAGPYLIVRAANASGSPLTGALAGNYVLPDEQIVPVPLIVEPKPITYQTAGPAGAVVYTSDFDVAYQLREGEIAGTGTSKDDVRAALDDIVFVRESDGAAFRWGARLPVGTYRIRLGALSGEAAANYVLDHDGSSADLLYVEPLPLTNYTPHLTAVYGDELIFDAPGYEGLQIRVEVRLVDGTPVPKPGVGPGHVYVITELLGPEKDNFTLPASPSLGTLEILKRTVTVTIPDFQRTYGDPVSVGYTLHNAAYGETSLAGIWFKVVQLDTRLGERTPVGSYTIMVGGHGDPNYELDLEGSTWGTVTINPRPIVYTLQGGTITYGDEDRQLGTVVFPANAILPGDDVRAGKVVVVNREQYPKYLPATAVSGQVYELILIGLEGEHKANYVLDHENSYRGSLFVEQRPVAVEDLKLLYFGHAITGLGTGTYKFGELEWLYGVIHGQPESAFALDYRVPTGRATGLLADDDVWLATFHPVHLAASLSTQGYLNTGTYTWELLLQGPAARNYKLETQDLARTITIQARRITVRFETRPLTYGDMMTADAVRPVIDIEGDYDDFFAGADLRLAPLEIWHGDFRVSYHEELNVRTPFAGYFAIRLLDPELPFLGADAGNFALAHAVSGGFTVDPRPVRILAPEQTTWVYGTRLEVGSLAGAVVGPNGQPAFLPGDDVHLHTDGALRLDATGRFNPWRADNVPGTYGPIIFELRGLDAFNYVLVEQPAYNLTIVPRPLEIGFRSITVEDGVTYLHHMYGFDMPVLAGEYGGVLSWDDCCEILFRDAEGNLKPFSELKTGDYAVGLELTGPDAYKYSLRMDFGDNAVIRVDPRPLRYIISDSIGQYGNFLPCDDPITCNGGRRSKGPWLTGWYDYSNVWVPGKITGDVVLVGLVPGDDVVPGEIVLVDFEGHVGRVEDVPPPGFYWQVLSGLEGADAANYVIAPEDNRPGLLQIVPMWVFWMTFPAVYMPETGWLSSHPEYGDLIAGPGVHLYAAGQVLPAEAIIGAYLRRGEGQCRPGERCLFRIAPEAAIGVPGVYELWVEGLGGPAANYLIPFPVEAAYVGRLTVFPDSSLGLDSVAPVPVGLEQTESGEIWLVGPGGRPAQLTSGDELQQRAEEDNRRWYVPQRAGTSAVFRDVALGLDDPKLGYGVNYEVALSADATARTYATVLLEYGVTFTNIRLYATQGQEIVYDFDWGDVRAGVQAEFLLYSKAGPSGITGQMSAVVGTSAGTGVDFNYLFGLPADLRADVGIYAGARVKYGFGYQDGKLQLGLGGVTAGQWAELGTSFGIGDGPVRFDGSISLVTGAVVAIEMPRLTIDLDDGDLIIGFSWMAAFGIGFQTADYVRIDFDEVKRGFEALGCGLGMGGCPPSVEELAVAQLRTAMEIRDPVARFEYLAENAEWALLRPESLPPDLRQAWQTSRDLVNRMDALQSQLDEYLKAQHTARSHFFQRLRSGQGGQAMLYAQRLMENAMQGYQPGSPVLQEMQREMDALGLELVMNENGQAAFKWKYQ